jgi:membrane AbrB-like protein
VCAVRPWILLVVLVAAASEVLYLAGLPTPLLFGGLLGALAYALLRPNRPLTLPNSWFEGGQAVVGVIAGAGINWASLTALGYRWLIVVLVSCFSLAVSVLAGQMLMRHGVTRVTATFSSIAGGAAGLTALADDLKADSRVVAVLQYLRLLVVLVTMPAVVTIVFRAHGTGGSLAGAASQWTVGLPFAAIAIGLGYTLGKAARLPSAAILGPLVVGALLTLIPYFRHAVTPTVIQDAGYAVIGVQVGLRFTVASVKAIGRMVPTALGTVLITLLACAALGWVLTVTTNTSGLDAYLATTPGGIYAVMGTAASTGGDVTFVAAAQILRLLIVLGSAPFVSAYLRRGEPPATAEGAEAGQGAP